MLCITRLENVLQVLALVSMKMTYFQQILYAKDTKHLHRYKNKTEDIF
jgi:hypothetical protein